MASLKCDCEVARLLETALWFALADCSCCSS